jgi:hypothetical protein
VTRGTAALVANPYIRDVTPDAPDPLVAVVFCMFERCWSTEARPTTIGHVTRDLCVPHEAILRDAMGRDAASLEVHWGEPVEAEIRKIEAHIGALVARHGEPPREYLTPDVDTWSLDDVPCPGWDEEQCRAWDAIELARDEILTLRDRQHQEPVVRIHGSARP